MTGPDNTAQTDQAPPGTDRRLVGWSRPRGVRQLADAVVCLAVAVILFRAFQVEGYMISTGSMAPALLGYHNRVVCPSCGFPFALGVTVDDAETGNSVAGRRPHDSTDENGRAGLSESGANERGSSRHAGLRNRARRRTAVCPNCGLPAIDVSRVPRNQGDQLLVHKHAFLLRSPRRWEVAVFRNPYKPTQAYVKRIVGLPGESIQVIDGDVYVDGSIRRKPLVYQRAIRIPVYDHAYRPAIERDSESPAGNWQPRWRAEPAHTPWTVAGERFDFDGDRDNTGLSESGSNADVPELAWVRYRHLVRATDPEQPPKPAPVTDFYAYNRPDEAPAVHAVRDLMLSAQVTIHRTNLRSVRDGGFVVEMTDGGQTFGFVIDVTGGEVRLYAIEPESQSPARRTVVRRAPFSLAEYEDGRMLVEMSLMDRQVLAAIDGELPFDPWPMPEQRPAAPPPTSPVRFGARGLSVSVADLKLFRDVYYTEGQGINGVEGPYALGSGEYFVLGDNSPVSLDSRSWADGAVSRRLFIGKPFLVHLPSRPGKLRIGDHNAYFRIPDLSRIRYIH